MKWFWPKRRWLLWIGGAVVLLLVIAVAAAYFIDEPLRRRLEGEMNARLKGYTVRVGRADFHPVGLSLDLEQLVISQNENPEPPIAQIPSLTASVQWRALFSGRLVADFEIDDPKVVFDLRQFSQEAKDAVPVKEKGWQEALQAVYPLKINRFTIRNGDLTYIDKGPFKPLRITQLQFVAENIRNVESAKGTYPSPVEVEGIVFDKGKIGIKGDADFFAEPHVAFKADVALTDIGLDYFRPIAERYQLSVRRGAASATGSVEYAPDFTRILIQRLTLAGADADYIHQTREAPTKTVVKEAGKTARKHANEPTFELKVDQVVVRDSQLGYVNRAAKPEYRVYFSDTALDVQNLSNHLKEGIARARLKAKFMGSGASEAQLAFRPEEKGPDFDLVLSIVDTDMRRMNDLFRAYGNFDVVAGVFSFFCELKVRQGKIDGYVKPLFRDMDVYDERQDREKGLFRKLYEGLVGGLSGLLRNTPRKEVATEIPISGDIESPQTSTWDTLLGIIQNAFFKAILPGFEREVTASGKTRRPAKSASVGG
jgi:hypothetical protein